MKSEHNKTHDPIENWLLQRLRDYSPEAPGDSWHRLVPHLPLRKRRRPFAFWIWGAAVGVFVTFAFSWYLKNTYTSSSAYPDSNKKPLVAQILPNTLPEKVNGRDNHKGQKRLIDKSTNNWVAKNSGIIDSPSSKHNPITKHLIDSSANILENLTAEGITHIHKYSTTSTNMVSGNMEMENSRIFDFSQATAASQLENPFDKLSAKAYELLFLAEKPHLELQFSTAPIFLKKSKTSRIWLGIEAAPAFFIQKNKHEIPDGLAFPEMHSLPGYGWQFGVSLAIEPFKNWRITTGIQHIGQKHKTEHSASLRLMDGVCLNPNDTGLKEYEFHYVVVSGGEQSNLTLMLQQQDLNSTMPDDEPFTIDMKTTKRSMLWRIPFTVERQFGTKRWKGLVRGGAIVDFGEKSNNEVTHFTEFCQDLCFQGGHTPAIQTSSVTHLSLGWLIACGIERQISNRINIRFEPFLVGQKESMQYGLNFGLLLSN
jgi:hypothetical protein